MTVTIEFVGKKEGDDFLCEEINMEVPLSLWEYKYTLEFVGEVSFPSELVEREGLTAEFLQDAFDSDVWGEVFSNVAEPIETQIGNRIANEFSSQLRMERGEASVPFVSVYFGFPEVEINKQGDKVHLRFRRFLISIYVNRYFIYGVQPQTSPRPLVEKNLSSIISLIEDGLKDLLAGFLADIYTSDLFVVEEEDVVFVGQGVHARIYGLVKDLLETAEGWLNLSNWKEELKVPPGSITSTRLTVTLPRPVTVSLKKLEELKEGNMIPDFVLGLSSFFVERGITGENFVLMKEVVDLIKEGRLNYEVKLTDGTSAV